MSRTQAGGSKVHSEPFPMHTAARSAIQLLLVSYAHGAPVSVYELAGAVEELLPQIDFIDLLDITTREIVASGRSASWEPAVSGKLT